MTRDEIIAMAREADLPMAWISDAGIVFWEDLERFAALVAAREREACAHIAENGLLGHTIAKAIRARGE